MHYSDANLIYFDGNYIETCGRLTQSAYEKNRIIPQELGQTDMGRDMLAEDYILKQLTASLIYPEKNLGKEFWSRVYAKAREMYGTTQIPVNTFNKVWIVADTAKVLERNNAAYVIGSHLKVMLEEDYLALQKHSSSNNVIPAKAGIFNEKSHSIASQVIRSIILPAIEKEVNQGKNFALLRQMFYSMILASWYKLTLKDAFLNQTYSNKGKTRGVLSDDPKIKEKIYREYLKAYKKGVFNFIKEDVDEVSKQVIPRKYFSGGLLMMRNPAKLIDRASTATLREREDFEGHGDMAMVEAKVDPTEERAGTDHARVTSNSGENLFEDLYRNGTISIPDKVEEKGDYAAHLKLRYYISKERKAQLLHGLRVALSIFASHSPQIDFQNVVRINVRDLIYSTGHDNHIRVETLSKEVMEGGKVRSQVSLDFYIPFSKKDEEYPYIIPAFEGHESNVFLRALVYTFGKIPKPPEPEDYTAEQFRPKKERINIQTGNGTRELTIHNQTPAGVFEALSEHGIKYGAGRAFPIHVPPDAAPIEKLNLLIHDRDFTNKLLKEWLSGWLDPYLKGDSKIHAAKGLHDLLVYYSSLIRSGRTEEELPLSVKEARRILTVFFSAPALPFNEKGVADYVGVEDYQDRKDLFSINEAKDWTAQWVSQGGSLRGSFYKEDLGSGPDAALLAKNKGTELLDALLKQSQWSVGIPKSINGIRNGSDGYKIEDISPERQSQYMYGLRQALFIFFKHLSNPNDFLNVKGISITDTNVPSHFSDKTRVERTDDDRWNFFIPVYNKDYPYLSEGSNPVNYFLEALLFSFPIVPDLVNFTENGWGPERYTVPYKTGGGQIIQIEKRNQTPAGLLRDIKKYVEYPIPSAGTDIEKLNVLIHDPTFGYELWRRQGVLPNPMMNNPSREYTSLSNIYHAILIKGGSLKSRSLSPKEIRIILSEHFSAPAVPEKHPMDTSFGNGEANRQKAIEEAAKWALEAGPLWGSYSLKDLKAEEDEAKKVYLRPLVSAVLPDKLGETSLDRISDALRHFLLNENSENVFTDNHEAYLAIRDAVDDGVREKLKTAVLKSEFGTNRNDVIRRLSDLGIVDDLRTVVRLRVNFYKNLDKIKIAAGEDEGVVDILQDCQEGKGIFDDVEIEKVKNQYLRRAFAVRSDTVDVNKLADHVF